MMKKPWWMSQWWNLPIALMDIVLAIKNFAEKNYILTVIFTIGTIFALTTLHYINKREQQKLQEEIINSL